MANQGGDFTPYMFGGSYGVGGTQNAPNPPCMAREMSGQGVGQCMYWPLSLQQQRGGNQGQQMQQQRAHQGNTQIQQRMQQMAQQQQQQQNQQSFPSQNTMPSVTYSTPQPQGKQWYGNDISVGAPTVTYDFGDMKPQPMNMKKGKQVNQQGQEGGEMSGYMPYQPPMMGNMGTFPTNPQMGQGMGMSGRSGYGQTPMKKRPWR